MKEYKFGNRRDDAVQPGGEHLRELANGGAEVREEATEKEYIITDKLYHVLKWVGLIACPAVATFVGAVFPAWGIPNADAVVLTLNATGVLIGALIGVSVATSKQVSERTD